MSAVISFNAWQLLFGAITVGVLLLTAAVTIAIKLTTIDNRLTAHLAAEDEAFVSIGEKIERLHHCGLRVVLRLLRKLNIDPETVL